MSLVQAVERPRKNSLTLPSWPVMINSTTSAWTLGNNCTVAPSVSSSPTRPTALGSSWAQAVQSVRSRNPSMMT